MIPPKRILLEFQQRDFALDSLRYRLDNKYSREDFGEILGVSKGTVASFEGSIRPRVDVFFNMCRIMGKGVDDYFKAVEL